MGLQTWPGSSCGPEYSLLMYWRALWLIPIGGEVLIFGKDVPLSFHLKGKKERLPENILYTSRDLRRARSVMWLHLSRSDHQEWNNERRKGTMCLYFALILVPGFFLSRVFCNPGIDRFAIEQSSLQILQNKVSSWEKSCFFFDSNLDPFLWPVLTSTTS